MKALSRPELLFCPYKNCGKVFTKPLMLTDSTGILRKTYYACPHCHSKLDIKVEDFHVVHIGKCTGGERTPVKVNCPYSFGHLRTLSENAPIPDECLTCPKLLHCHIKDSL
jgi:DNA-directed RNA polymerase subunit RPC12/RpoP